MIKPKTRMKRKKKMIRPEEMNFQTAKQKKLAAKLINYPSKAVTHSTINSGTWDIIEHKGGLSPASGWVLKGRGEQ